LLANGVSVISALLGEPVTITNVHDLARMTESPCVVSLSTRASVIGYLRNVLGKTDFAALPATVPIG